MCIRDRPLVGRKPHGRDVLHDNHQRRQQPCNLHPGQTRVNFFTGRGGDGHDSPILDDCFEKALFFIDFIDEKRPYQPSQASYYGKYLKMIFFSYFHLWLYISIWEITRIPSARLHQYTLPHWIFPDFAETAAAILQVLPDGSPIAIPYFPFINAVCRERLPFPAR